ELVPSSVLPESSDRVSGNSSESRLDEAPGKPIEDGLPPVGVGDGNGYQPEHYHPRAPASRELRVDLRGRPGDPAKVRLFYEAKPGTYRMRIVNDKNALVAGGAADLLFYSNGDSASLTRDIWDRIQIQSQYHARVSGDQEPVAEFEIVPGTQKFSVVAAWTSQALRERTDSDEVPNSHTVAVFYAYPDLTYRDAAISRDRILAGDEFQVQFQVHNCGVVQSSAGIATIRMDPQGFRSRAVICRIPYRSIMPGATEIIRQSIATHRLIPAGDYRVSVQIDATDTTIERDELGLRGWQDGMGSPFIPPCDAQRLVPFNNDFHFDMRVVAPVVNEQP
ncbi:MAG: hypothetical protein AAGA03_16375, partial [Planctomycetota bacterium]